MLEENCIRVLILQLTEFKSFEEILKYDNNIDYYKSIEKLIELKNLS